jgi:hypothetical protein
MVCFFVLRTLPCILNLHAPMRMTKMLVMKKYFPDRDSWRERYAQAMANTNDSKQLRIRDRIERLRFVEDPHVAFARESPATVEEPHCRSMKKCDYRSAPPSHADRLARGSTPPLTRSADVVAVLWWKSLAKPCWLARLLLHLLHGLHGLHSLHSLGDRNIQ